MEKRFKFKQRVSQEVFENKYCLNGESSVEEVLAGVAQDISLAEATPERQRYWENIFYEEMVSERLFPAGRILANARLDTKMRYYNNCYTVGIDDSIEDIYETLSDDAKISSTGGGVGINVSNLRYKGCPISKGGESSGVISFLEVFDQSAKIIHTGGGRRSAHIAILNIDHPEIESYITCKRGDENKKLTQFNISVGITDAFIEAVENDAEWDLVFDGETVKTVKAKYLFDLLTENSFWHNEPGIFNIDTVERYNTGHYEFKMDRVNPCGEICMPSYSVCCLSSLNLPAFIKKPFTDDAYFDFDAFASSVEIGVRFLDNVLTRTNYPIEKIKKMSEDWRRIGLGFTGLGTAFMMLKVKYGSAESKELSEKIASKLRLMSYYASTKLAEEKGAFPKFNLEEILKKGFVAESNWDEVVMGRIKKYGLRNIGLNTTAPTGCQVGTTMVNTSEGLLTLDELAESVIFNSETKRGEHTLEVPNEQWSIKQSDFVFDNGVVDTKKITVKSNLNLESTPNHKYRVILNGDYIWKRADELVVGDKIVYSIGGYLNEDYVNLNEPTDNHPNRMSLIYPKVITEDFAELLGLFYSDGSIHKKGIRFHFDYNSSESKHVVKLIKSVFGNKAKCSIRKERTCESVYFSSQGILEFLKANGLSKQKARDVEIPKKIRQSPSSVIQAFIDGYWLGDGSKTRDILYIDTFSKKMAEQLCVVMRSIGQNSRIGIYDKSKDSGSYSNNLSYRVYYVGFGSLNFLTSKNRYIAKDKRVDKEVCDKYGVNLFTDEILSIEDSRAQTYDISVPDGNTYMANSFISHNTTSLSLGNNCSSGIEPAFSLEYTRRIRQSADTDDVKEEKVYDKAWLDYQSLDENFGKEVEVPEYFNTTMDISIDDGLEIQAIFQKHIDHSISKTLNLPDGTTLEDYRDIYLKAYKMGLKGLTTFNPNGSMKGILEYSNKKENDKNEGTVEYHSAPPRPKDLECDIHEITVNGSKMLFVVGLLNGNPYELFCESNEDRHIDCAKHKKGILSKRKRGCYDLLIDKKVIASDLSHTFDEDFLSMARILSMSLRHGVPLQFIVGQLNKDSKFGSFQKGSARVLKKYIVDGEEVASRSEKESTCSECGGRLVFTDGCKQCLDCGTGFCG